MTKEAKKVRVTNPSGTDLEFENDPECPFYCELGICDHAGTDVYKRQMVMHLSLTGQFLKDYGDIVKMFYSINMI